MLRTIYLSLLIIVAAGCEKMSDPVKVTYRVSRAYSSVEVTWRDSENDLQAQTIPFESIQDLWQKSLTMQPGQIVYLSAIYADSASSANVQVLMNGKVYKEAFSSNEPDKYIIVSGVIPY
ncbi:MAG: hypothetical protein ACNA7V_00130 [Bacteroidales bacterium]